MTMMPTHPKEDRLAKRVFDRIADEKLRPRPRWEFLWRNYFFWGFGAVAVVLGALAVSAMLFEVESVDWRLALVTHSNFFSFFLAAAPFLWMGSLLLFVLIGYRTVRETNHGYRYPLSIIIIGAVLASLSLGTALYTTGFGRIIETTMGDNLPFHHPILEEEREWWQAPEKGLLGGSVVSIASDATSFVLRDFNGQLWTIDESDLRTFDSATIARGGVVRVIGVPLTADSGVFHACFVIPWEFRGSFASTSPPLPLGVVASTSERSSSTERSDICRGIRPYQQLRSIDDDGF
jgi:hypothetical protein